MRNSQVNNPPHGARGVHESASRSVSKQATLFEYTPSDGGVVVKVLRIAPVRTRGNLQAFQEEIPTRDGGRAYVTLITPPDTISEAIQEAILEAWGEVISHG